ncbi:14069_t:CDS:2 [Funneliformis mosseae]|uniref:Ceramide very long chain fatty acid hydroxylase n=1 Tax=Funneliformis mosseae TaxID=27381 RepID=A0A9N9HCT8_FUNMO|nr:14069_t:CDS:2 [Funneliformis mosseae]
MPGRMLFRYTREEVAKHNTVSDLWVIYNNKVYDVTEFAVDHPGGPELIRKWGGKDVTKILVDPISHVHSDVAYDVLADMCMGEVVEGPSTGNNNTPLSLMDKKTMDNKNYFDEKTFDRFQPQNTDIKSDFQKEKFLDLNKPLFDQVVNSKFSKEFYLEQIHQPRHLPYSARLFANPWLELLTKTPWYAIPILWIPVVSYHLFMASELGSKLVTIFFIIGIGVWTFLEYVLHRYLFHVDSLLPDHPYALTVHFALHGIHHYLPMDNLRLVMPPVLGFTIAWPISQLAYLIFPTEIAHAIMAGAKFAYTIYDVTHFHLHHSRPFGKHLREMKTYHLAHHYKNYELGYGISSKMWDYVFGTILVE